MKYSFVFPNIFKSIRYSPSVENLNKLEDIETEFAIPIFTTSRVLTVQLKKLKDHGMITKKIYPELPPKVGYTLTEIGWSLMPVIDAMNQWGDFHRSFFTKHD